MSSKFMGFQGDSSEWAIPGFEESLNNSLASGVGYQRKEPLQFATVVPSWPLQKLKLLAHIEDMMPMIHLGSLNQPRHWNKPAALGCWVRRIKCMDGHFGLGVHCLVLPFDPHTRLEYSDTTKRTLKHWDYNAQDLRHKNCSRSEANASSAFALLFPGPWSLSARHF